LKVQLKYYGVMREITQKREENVEVEDSIMLSHLVRLMVVKYGTSMESYVFDQNTNAPRPIHLFLVNGKIFTASQTSNTKLEEGSVISIIPTQGG
jgi:molybdopterin converting factor small subunit